MVSRSRVRNLERAGCQDSQRSSLATVTVTDPRVKTAISMMRRLSDTQLSIRAVCERVNLSPRRLGQLFKKEIGIAPGRYLRIVRMEKAESLLQTSFLTIKEITFQSGMTDVSHFVRNFKKRYGMTPTEFRARISR